MTQKQIEAMVKHIADKFQRCEDSHVRYRAGEAVLHLLMACDNEAKLLYHIIDMVDEFYTCYVYGEGQRILTDEYTEDHKEHPHVEFLVKYCRKIGFGLCAEDASVIEDYITEIVAYRKEHAA